MKNGEFSFDWKLIGNIKEGRPNLGELTYVAVYRLMHYSIRDVLDDKFGSEKAEEILKESGKLVGYELCRNELDIKKPFNEFISELRTLLIDMKIGVLRIEMTDLKKMSFVITIAEDLECSGLPLMGRSVCEYDEGLIAGIFNYYYKKEFDVEETDCWTTGAKICRFAINQKE